MTSESAPRPALWKSRSFQLVLGLCVSIACLWWAAGDLISKPKERDQFVNAFRMADYRFLPLLLGMLFSFYTLKAYRWKLLLTPLGEFRTFGDCFGPMLSGFAVNNVLPARAGEIVRAMVFARRTSQPLASVLATIALERIFDMICVLVLLSAGLLSLPDMGEGMRSKAIGMGIVVAVGVAGAATFIVWTPAVLRLINWGLALIRVPEQLRERIRHLLETAATGLASVKSPTRLALIAVVSLLQWTLNGAMMYLSLQSFGVDVPIAAAMVLLGVVALGVAVPASPGFFGVIQLCFTKTLQIFPVSQPAVLAASIYYHMIQYIPVTLLGLLWLSRSGFQLRESSVLSLQSSVRPVSSPSPLTTDN